MPKPPKYAPAGPDAPGLFPGPPPRPPGKNREALDATLRAWAKRRHLTGASNRAKVELLRTMADALDERPSPGMARAYESALNDAAPTEAPAADPRHVALEDEALRIISAVESADPGPSMAVVRNADTGT